MESKNLMIETFKLQLNNAETIIKDQQVRADKDKQSLELKVIKQYDSHLFKFKLTYCNLQLLDLQKELKDYEQKYNELFNDYEVVKNYIIQTQQITEGVQLVSEKNVSIAVDSKFNLNVIII